MFKEALQRSVRTWKWFLLILLVVLLPVFLSGEAGDQHRLPSVGTVTAVMVVMWYLTHLKDVMLGRK